jgi:CyaY protein
MDESEFLELADATLSHIERAVEAAADAAGLDIECSRSGNVLEIELVDCGTKLIVNSQAAMQEIWVAARAGGFHYKRAQGAWLDTRGGEELFVALSRLIGDQAGVPVKLNADA